MKCMVAITHILLILTMLMLEHKVGSFSMMSKTSQSGLNKPTQLFTHNSEVKAFK
jgi:hypothetical protein